jgi:hypothetical protein
VPSVLKVVLSVLVERAGIWSVILVMRRSQEQRLLPVASR